MGCFLNWSKGALLTGATPAAPTAKTIDGDAAGTAMGWRSVGRLYPGWERGAKGHGGD